MAGIENIEAHIEAEFQWLHRHPELSYEEAETTNRIRVSLERAEIRIMDLPLKTGLVAEVGEGDTVVVLRADIDALRKPYIMCERGPQECTQWSRGHLGAGLSHLCTLLWREGGGQPRAAIVYNLNLGVSITSSIPRRIIH